MRGLFWGVVVVFGAALLGPARAADEAATTLDYFTVENVSAALTELGATDLKTYDAPGGHKGIQATLGGYKLAMSIQQCDAAGCVGLLFGTLFSTEGRDVPAETLLSFTRKYPPTPALRAEGGVGIMRALISNGGIRSTNLKANFAMLIGIIPEFVKHVNEATVASNPRDTRAMLSAPQLRPMAVTPAQVREWTLPALR
jgi:hypothetical protein